jgi:proteic killer suppression protein
MQNERVKAVFSSSNLIDMYTVCVYRYLVIMSFADATTEHIYNGINTKMARKVDRRIWPVLVRKLDILNAATTLGDLKSLGNQLERLKDDLAGYWSIRVNDQYRVIFQFAGGNATDVRCQDIH